ncbi:MAG: DUF948 domain-containing protein [Phycisphaerales bacterium]
MPAEPITEPTMPDLSADQSIDKGFVQELDAWGRRELNRLGDSGAHAAPPEAMLAEVRRSGAARTIARGVVIAIAFLALVCLLAVMLRSAMDVAPDPVAPRPAPPPVPLHGDHPHGLNDHHTMPTHQALLSENAGRPVQHLSLPEPRGGAGAAHQPIPTMTTRTGL